MKLRQALATISTGSASDENLIVYWSVLFEKPNVLFWADNFCRSTKKSVGGAVECACTAALVVSLDKKKSSSKPMPEVRSSSFVSSSSMLWNNIYKNFTSSLKHEDPCTKTVKQDRMYKLSCLRRWPWTMANATFCVSCSFERRYNVTMYNY